jgi:uncharacterized membrane protein
MKPDTLANLLKDAEKLSKEIDRLQSQHRALMAAAAYYKKPVSTGRKASTENSGTKPYHGKTNEVLSFVLNKGSGEPKEISSLLGIPMGSLFRILKDLVTTGTIKKVGKGKYVPTQKALDQGRLV